MPFNGSGTFVSLPPPDFPALPGTVILASSFNANMNDLFANGLTKCITRDGQSPPTANLPMAGFRFTGIGAGVADTDSAQLGQTLSTRGQVGVVDWNTRITNGIFEATAASLTAPAANFPPTSDLGELTVIAQGAIVNQVYQTAGDQYLRMKIAGNFTQWSRSIPRQNYIINGACSLWQEASSLVAGTGRRYAMDQAPDESNGVTYTTALVAWPLGQTDVDPRAYQYRRTVVTNVAGIANYCLAKFPMEGVSTLAGKQVVVSFWAKANAALPVSIELEQNFGTGGGPSAPVQTFVSKITLSTTWTRYQATIVLPSVSGKTLGTNVDNHLALHIWFNAGSNYNVRTSSLGQQSGTFDLWGIKVEEGSVATAFMMNELSVDTVLCQRYFEIIEGTGFATAGKAFTAVNYVAASNPYCPVWYRVTKRSIPVITFPAGAIARYVSNVGVFAAAIPLALAINIDGFTLSCSAAPAASFGFMDNFGRIYIDSRLV